ncbi:MAG: siderophore biosynthesis protein SbnG [Elusimicrobia bacterium]|nr:siderophore biosynthesis protein SbnG [Elusimicrobiota bacterium]
MLEKNPLKEKLAAGKACLGTWNTLASPLVTDALAHSGLDFVIVDMEHGAFKPDLIGPAVSACEARGVSALVRMPALEDWLVLQALDQGAHGVVIPHIESAEDAKKLVSYAKYHPLGTRGFTPFPKGGGFTGQGAATYAARANLLTMTAAIVESKAGLDALDGILGVEGLDVVYFGAYDLSQALGVPGQVDSPALLKVIEDGVRRARKAGKAAGGFVPRSREHLKRCLDMGMTFITYEVDSSALARPYAEAAAWLREGQ